MDEHEPHRPLIIVALAGIGTAVVLFPILKKQNETLALGLVASRILESATIFVGVAFLLSIVTLRKDGAGAQALVTSHTLVILYNRIFLLGQSFMPAICDLLLGFLLYQSQLVPRRLSRIGIIGGPHTHRRLPRCAVRSHRTTRPRCRVVRATGRGLRVLARRVARRQRVPSRRGRRARESDLTRLSESLRTHMGTR